MNFSTFWDKMVSTTPAPAQEGNPTQQPLTQPTQEPVNDLASDTQVPQDPMENQDTQITEPTDTDPNPFADDPRYQHMFQQTEDVNPETKPPAESNPPAEDPNNAIIQQLQEQNAQMMQMLQNITGQQQQQTEPQKPAEPEDLFESDTFKTMTKALNMDDSDSQLFKVFMQKFADQHADNVLAKAMEQTPELVNTTVNKQFQRQTMAQEFYKSHEALAPVKPYVKQVANAIAAQNPGMPLQDVLNQTATTVYKTLNISPTQKQVTQPTKQPVQKQKPAFATAQGSRKAPVRKTQMQMELDAMMADF